MLSFLLVGLSHTAPPSHAVAGRLYVLKGDAFVVGEQDQEGRLVQVCRANDTIQVNAHAMANVWLMGSGLRYQLSSPSVVKIVNGSVISVKGARPKQLSKLPSDITKAFPDPTAQAAVQFRSADLRITPSGGLATVPDALSWD